MQNKILDGKQISKEILKDIKNTTESLETKPNLVVISVGENKESELYINKKQDACYDVGFIFTHLHYEITTTNELIKKLQELSLNEEIHGIIVQLPLPSTIDTELVAQAIAP
jgi:methylenetetrahydrofolate dehydrogenase (NADP+)/methenyltetrahydrofolate cyclohydrolase